MDKKKPFLALLPTFESPADPNHHLHLEMLLYLDDQHYSVRVRYHDRLPRWIQRSRWWSNVYYFFLVAVSPASVVLADSALLYHLGLSMTIGRWVSRHRWMIFAQESLLTVQPGFVALCQRWLIKTLLAAADRLLLGSRLAQKTFRDFGLCAHKLVVLNAGNAQPGSWFKSGPSPAERVWPANAHSIPPGQPCWRRVRKRFAGLLKVA